MPKIRLDYHLFQSDEGSHIGIFEATKSAHEAGAASENDDFIQIALGDSSVSGGQVDICTLACEEANKTNPKNLKEAILSAIGSLYAESVGELDSERLMFMRELMLKFKEKFVSIEAQTDKAKALKATASPSIVINAPSLFADPQFVEWLNNGSPKATWHQGGEPDEWSDVVVMVDPSLNGEGTDSDMPEHIWNQIVDACREALSPQQGGNHIMVRLMNMEEDVVIERPRG